MIADATEDQRELKSSGQAARPAVVSINTLLVGEKYRKKMCRTVIVARTTQHAVQPYI
jgi:hypothetical protein